jgi:LysM repeat protein
VWVARLAAPAALLCVAGAIFAVATTRIGDSGQAVAGKSVHTRHRHLPPYWTVRPGDTFTKIAARTGLTIAQLEAYNPAVEPSSIAPGQRLLLRRNPPVKHAGQRPLGPRFWTVRSGESFGSIAAKTRISITTLESLNPGLKPSTLQPGDRVKLRR